MVLEFLLSQTCHVQTCRLASGRWLLGVFDHHLAWKWTGSFHVLFKIFTESELNNITVVNLFWLNWTLNKSTETSENQKISTLSDIHQR